MSAAHTAPRHRSLLVLGGARSGKSRYAQALVERARSNRLFIATAQAGDAEMAARIARHRADRGPGWETIEEPLELSATLRKCDLPGRAVLVDCITLWLSNLMFSGRDPAHEVAELVEEIGRFGAPLVFVSNEVGLGDRARNRARTWISGLAGPSQPGDRARLRCGRLPGGGAADPSKTGSEPQYSSGLTHRNPRNRLATHDPLGVTLSRMLRLFERRTPTPSVAEILVAHDGETYRVALKQLASSRRFTLRVRAASRDVLLTMPSRSIS